MYNFRPPGVTPNRGMGPPWGAFCQITLTSCFRTISYSHNVHVFPYQTSWQYSDGTPLTGASNARVVGRNRYSEPIYGFVACCGRCDRLGVINTVPPDRGRLRHLSLVVSGGVCWWPKTTTKCLWQKVSTLLQRQQKSINLHAVMPILRKSQ